jgi:hypothetical protein
MQWQQSEPAENETLKIPPSWLFAHYYEALNVLFRIENALRTFVFIVLKDKEGLKWKDLSIKTEDGSDTTISAIAKRRLSQDKEFGYLGYAISSPLMHLTSGELIRIILADSNWPLFTNYFPAHKSIVQTKLEEIGNVRNALAHFRPITPDDVQVVKQNANQVLAGVERLLENIVSCTDIVPTNSKDDWYNQLKTLAGPYTEVRFTQSTDQNWVRLGITYSCPILGVPYSSENFRSYKVLLVNTPRILFESTQILETVIFASELIPHVSMPAEGLPKFSKMMRLLFSRKNLADKHEILKKELEKILANIGTETDLMKEDSLARGELVQSASIMATRDITEKTWAIEYRKLGTTSQEKDPVEYWAGHTIWGSNFISNAESFPWMPVKISGVTFPFD